MQHCEIPMDAVLMAFKKGPSEIVELLGRVSDAHVMHVDDYNGSTALMLASEEGHLAIVELLLGRVTDAHVMHVDKEGNTALMWASRNGHPKIVELLLERVTDAHVMMHADEEGPMWASVECHPEIVELLQQRIHSTKRQRVT